MKLLKKRKSWKAVLLLAGAVLLCVCLSVGAYHYIGRFSEPYIYNNVEDCPQVPVALMLGCGINYSYRQRLRAAARLYNFGKVRAVIVSGDNATADYNEPGRMRRDLIKLGVPGKYITCDYAGFRTLDSVVRAKKVFKQDKFIVVSQRFHTERAVYLSRKTGGVAYGLSASKLAGYMGRRGKLREYFARTRAVFDVLFGVEPKFYGKLEKVPLRAR